MLSNHLILIVEKRGKLSVSIGPLAMDHCSVGLHHTECDGYFPLIHSLGLCLLLCFHGSSHLLIVWVTFLAASCCTKCPASGIVTSVKSPSGWLRLL